MMSWAPPPPKVTVEFTMPAPLPFVLDPAKTACIIVDVQERMIRREDMGDTGRGRQAAIIPGCVRLLQKARDARAPVVFIQSVRTPQSLDIARFGCEPRLFDRTPEVEIAREIAPRSDEPVVKKFSHDPWLHTSLEDLLTGRGIVPVDGTLIVAGISAAGCAFACALGSSNRQYMTLIPMDCTAAASVEQEASAYAKYMAEGYSCNIAFTHSELLTFRAGAEAPELQLSAIRQQEAVSTMPPSSSDSPSVALAVH